MEALRKRHLAFKEKERQKRLLAEMRCQRRKDKELEQKELARATKAAGEEYFLADCRKHGAGVKFLVGCRVCMLCKSERSKQYYKNNKESISEYQKEYNKKYREENASYIFARSTLSRIENDRQEAFSGITKSEAESLCGYSQVEFLLHIESTFKEGMSWENRSEWHIDHILPVAWFKSEGICDIRLINSLNNLEALPATENISKGATFQGKRISEQSYFDWLQISEGIDWDDVVKAG